eukprot:6486188-Pyramimonas_sp.AAC.1
MARSDPPSLVGLPGVLDPFGLSFGSFPTKLPWGFGPSSRPPGKARKYAQQVVAKGFSAPPGSSRTARRGQHH